ncbi:myosin-9-like isoform X1 [Biomphalaria pfeifferi]|uniref:Myosin-9-like isoform X1 n=1 Tax=Biomphalaria pfeifferi TaxID=112525 RepID=A0AAD8BXN2_BIOPF|nr:myosin-9-like isoform X1 [Biomphalaria pfeifferi]
MTSRNPRLSQSSSSHYSRYSHSTSSHLSDLLHSGGDSGVDVRSLPPTPSYESTCGPIPRKGGQIQKLMGEFKSLYTAKSKRLDDVEKGGEDVTKVRNRMLQSYVNDLVEQNDVLVQTVEELEREANEKLLHLEDKLSRSNISCNYQALGAMQEVDNYCDVNVRGVYRGRPPPRSEEATLRDRRDRYVDSWDLGERRSRSPGSPNRPQERDDQRVPSPKRVTWKEPVEQKKTQNNDYLSKCRELERELRSISIEKTRAETLIEDLQTKLARQEEQTAQVRAQNSNLNYDIDQLIDVVRAARMTGTWEIDRIKFRELTIDQVFGSIHETFPKLMGRETDSSELLQQVRQKDDRIESLERELRALRFESKGVIVGDQISEPTDLSQVKSDLRRLEQRVEDLKQEIHSRDRKISGLTSQISDLQAELNMKDSENSNYQQTIKLLQDKIRQSTLELTKSEEVSRQLKSDLASIRDQNSQSSHSVSHYERRIRALEAELVEAKDQRRKNLDEIGALQEKLREGNISTHDHHEVLKSELARRDDTIQKLRRDVLTLQEKRDSSLAECETAIYRLSKTEQKLSNAHEEIHRMEKKTKALEDEVLHVRSQLNEADNETKTANKKVTRLEGELQALRGQNDEFQGQVSKLTKSLQRLQSSSKDTRDTLSIEVNDKQETIVRLRNDYRDLEEKLREALNTAQQRGEAIQQVKEELKQAVMKTQESQIKLEEADREHQQLQSRYTVQAKEIDRLQTELQEKELTSSQQETLFRSEVADREEEISRLKADLNIYHEKLAQSEGQLISREEQIARLQSQLRDLMGETSRKEENLRRFEEDLHSVEDERKRLEDILQRREITLQQVEHDLDMAKEKYKDAIEENGRLEARIQAFAINAQSEQDVLSTEVKCREEVIKRLKLDGFKLQEICSKYEEKSSQAEREVEHLKTQLRSSHNEVEVKKAAMKNLETNVEELKDKQGKQLEENSRLEDKIRDLTVAITTQEAQCEKLKHVVSTKEDLICQLRGDAESLNRQLKETVSKVLVRDENNQKLNVEIGKLKAKTQDKTKEIIECTKEIAKQSELIKKLQNTLTQCHQDLDELRRRADEDMLHKEEKIKQLQEDLLESQSQHSACYNELVKMEEEFELLKASHLQLNKVSQATSAQLTSLHDQINQLELDLTITNEKHRTCQKEVSNRDQVILRLQADLDTAQQNYSGSMEELKLNESEVKRIAGKLKQLQQEIRESHENLENKDNQAIPFFFS